MTSATMPIIRKESTYHLIASHNLAGVTRHVDAMAGQHEHVWIITLVFKKPYSPALGFIRDEADIDSGWGARIAELADKNLSKLMKLPATAENFACWLLFYWMPRLDAHTLNFEVDAILVQKGDHCVEVERTQHNKAAWVSFGGEVA